MPSGIICLVDGGRGRYAPQHFVQTSEYWEGGAYWAILALNEGPDHPHYWDAWDQVVDRARWTDVCGNVWRIFPGESGDIFAICPELMDPETRETYLDL